MNRKIAIFSCQSNQLTDVFVAASHSRVRSEVLNTVRDSGKQGGRHGEEPLDLSKKRPLRHRIIPLHC